MKVGSAGHEPTTESGHETLPRILGRLVSAGPGPTLICVGGLHGNEPAGVSAVRRVFAELSRTEVELRGEFVGICGNLTALARRRRYIEKDLNRLWPSTRLARAKFESSKDPTTVEDREAIGLLTELRAAFDRARGEVIIIDIHTTSGVSAPFATIDDTLRNRAIASHFPVPLVLGLEEQLDGTLLDLLTGLGHVTMGFEAGQHDAPSAVDHAEAAILIALVAAGLCDDTRLPQIRSARKLLAKVTRGIPSVLEVRFRQPVAPGDKFVMEPGFTNFQPVRPGQLLARAKGGEIRSSWRARLLLPLYQEQGDDGFFVVREFRPLWLTISALLRRLRFQSVVHWLPGIRRHPEHAETLIINRRFARFYALQLFHLLGFRKRRQIGDAMFVTRRSHEASNRPIASL